MPVFLASELKVMVEPSPPAKDAFFSAATGSTIDNKRPKMVTAHAGARTLQGLFGHIAIRP